MFPSIVVNTDEAGPVDIAFVTTRRDQVDAALPQLATLRARVVVSLVGLAGTITADDAAALRDEVLALLRSAEFPTAATRDMSAWLQTHAIFIASFESAIASVSGDAAVLAAHRAAVRALVKGAREGFSALEARGVTATPSALRVIFLRMLAWFATRYWRRQLGGELGRLGLAPHATSSRHTELPALQEDVRALLAGTDIPRLESIFAAAN